MVLGSLDRIVGRERRVKVEDRLVHDVAETAPAVLGPLPLEISGRDRDLVRGRAGRLVERDPVGVRREIAVLTNRGIVDALHPRLRLEAVALADVVIAELVVLLIAE